MSDTGKASRAQENATAARYGGTRNAGSGSFWSRKADVRTDRFLFESKIRMRNGKSPGSYTLKLKELRDLRKQAIVDDRIPVFQVEMEGHSYIVLDENDFVELIGLDT